MHCNSWMQIRAGSSKIVTTIIGQQEPILQLASVVGDLITNELHMAAFWTLCFSWNHHLHKVYVKTTLGTNLNLMQV